jgi:hypothetical protein
MRVAVCYSGAFRTFPKCWKRNHELFSMLGEIDYYISTWELPGYTKVARYDDQLAINGDTIYSDLPSKDFIITEDFLKSYLPFKRVDIDPMSKMEEIIAPHYNKPWFIMNPCRLVSQYYKLKRCFDLVVGDYDLVIRVRPDIKLDKIPDNIDPNRIYLPSMVYTTESAIISGMINEMFYISNMENMKKICGLYDVFEEMWNQNDAYGERMSFLNFQRNDLLDKCELFNFDITVVRENGKDEYIK